MKVKLGKAREGELKEISKIYMDEFSKPPYEENWTLKKSFQKINFFYEFYDLYSIKINKELVGFAVINPNFMCPGEIAFGEEIAIKEKFQGKGIGTDAINKLMKIYAEKGYESFMIIASKKSRAIKLYRKLGINDSNEGILMEKSLK
jgi:ribosomal protein S18 acetylase RimI-like enzyme